MSNITLELSDKLEAALTEAMKFKGIGSKEEYILRVIVERCAPPKRNGALADGTDAPLPEFDRDEAWIERMLEEGTKLREARE
jgi:hypothetical protein